MAENDWLIGLTAGLDDSKSKEQIKKDLEKIVKELTLALKIGKIELDEEQQNTIKAQLDKLAISLKDVSVDTEALNRLVEQVNGALSGIKIAGLDIKDGNTANQIEAVGQKIGGQLNQSISQSVDNSDILDNFKKRLKAVGIDSEKIDIVADKIEKLSLKIKLLNESIVSIPNEKGKDILSVDIEGIDTLGQVVKITQKYKGENLDLIKTIEGVPQLNKKREQMPILLLNSKKRQFQIYRIKLTS